MMKHLLRTSLEHWRWFAAYGRLSCRLASLALLCMMISSPDVMAVQYQIVYVPVTVTINGRQVVIRRPVVRPLPNPSPVALSVAVVGGGAVSSTPAGISCPGSCTASFPAASNVTLTATPASGQTFLGWSGGCAGNAACTLKLSAATSVTATFSNPAAVCHLVATPSTFAAQVAAAKTAQTVCLAAGDYGTWKGTDKAITITAQAGAAATMTLDLGLGDGGFTISDLTIAGARIYGNRNNHGSADRPRNITISRSRFTDAVDISDVADANILLDGNTFNDIDTSSSCTTAPARLWISGNEIVHSGVTVRNSVFSGGNSDGIQTGLGVNVINNEFFNIREKSSSDCAHTDAIQILGAKGVVLRGNYIHDTADGIVAYDGVDSAIIEDNVIDLRSGRFGIELYADRNSIVRHNTLVYGTGCEYAPCGGIYLDHKTGDPAGFGTIIENNVATVVNANNGSTAAAIRNNLLRSGATPPNLGGVPVYVGGSALTRYEDYRLAPGSPGKGAATDGLDIGIR